MKEKCQASSIPEEAFDLRSVSVTDSQGRKVSPEEGTALSPERFPLRVRYSSSLLHPAPEPRDTKAAISADEAPAISADKAHLNGQAPAKAANGQAPAISADKAHPKPGAPVARLEGVRSASDALRILVRAQSGRDP